MLNRLTVGSICLLSGLLLTVGEVVAQSHVPASADAVVGFRVGHGESYDSGGGAALDLTLTYGLRATGVGTWLVGTSFGLQTSALATDQDCRLLPGGGCAPDFPGLVSVSVLTGVQRGFARSASARLMLGPTYHQAWSGGGGIGLQGRVDVFAPTFRHTALVASVQHALVPSFRGEAVSVTSLGVGLRILAFANGANH